LSSTRATQSPKFKEETLNFPRRASGKGIETPLV